MPVDDGGTGAGPNAGAEQLAWVRDHNERIYALFAKLSTGTPARYSAPVNDWNR